MSGFFSGKAKYYATYRKGYPQEVFDTIISRFHLTPESWILDLGCGPGNIAIPLANHGLRVHAVDPEPEMIAEGKQIESNFAPEFPICWIIGSDASLPTIGLPALYLCTMGTSFHWMNRAALLQNLDSIIQPNGGIACINRNDSYCSDIKDGWGAAVQDVLQEMMGTSWNISDNIRFKNKDTHETIFLQSPFPVLEILVFPEQYTLTIDDIIGQLMSHSYIDPILLHERNAEFRWKITKRLLELEPSGQFLKNTAVQLIIAKRKIKIKNTSLHY